MAGVPADWRRQLDPMSSQSAQHTTDLKARLPTVDVVARDLCGIEFKRNAAKCPFPSNHSHGDRDPSLRFDNGKNRVFCASQNCFGEQGVDAFGLVQKMTGCGFLEAKNRLAEYYGVPAPIAARKSRSLAAAVHSGAGAGKPSSRSNKRPLASAEIVRQRLKSNGYRFAAEYPYGSNLRKVRFDHASDRQVGKNRPAKDFRWEHSREGSWYSGDGGLPKPLYVNEAFRKCTQPGLAVGFEGEGKADFASTFGVAAFSFKDMTMENAAALVDCEVVLWPDNDSSGTKQANSAAQTVLKCGARSVKLLEPPSEFSRSWDIVDAVQELKWDQARVGEFILTGKPIASEQPVDDANPHSPESRHFPFRISDDGVLFLKERSDGQIESTKISARLDVIAETRDGAGSNWGRLLTWRDNERRLHKWAMPMDLLASDGTAVRAHLLGEGLPFITNSPRMKERFTEYLQTAAVEKRIVGVSRIGWHGEIYVLPDQTFGPEGHCEMLYQSSGDTGSAWRVRGTSSEWRDRVGRPCSGNSRLIVAVGCGFAGPLLSIARGESGGIHFHGATSTGKSTALLVGASVCGGGGKSGFVGNWRNTMNGLEAVAEAHNDSTLFLDELAQVDPREAAEIAYLLANGQGKGRMSRNLGMRSRPTWSILFVSAGELTLAEHSASAGKRPKGGAEVRLLNIKADAGKGLGLFEELHGASSPQSFVHQLREAAQQEYGAPLREFLTRLVGDRNEAQQAILAAKDTLHSIIPVGASGEVRRAADRFAIIAAAGELATSWGLTGWKTGEAMTAAESCFKDWLKERGTSGSSDVEAGIQSVRSFISINGASRFQNIPCRSAHGSARNAEQQIVRLRAGFRRHNLKTDETEYLILPDVFRNEICAGYDSQAVAQELANRGHLLRQGKALQIKPRLPELGTAWVYGVSASILDGGKC